MFSRLHSYNEFEDRKDPRDTPDMISPITKFRADVGPKGNVRLDRALDERFRQALFDGVPLHLRSKMVEALAQMPTRASLAHSVRYFGLELPAIQARVRPLVDEIHDYLIAHRRLDGFRDWLIATGFTNEYRMVKVLDAWAQTKSGLDRLKPGWGVTELKT